MRSNAAALRRKASTLTLDGESERWQKEAKGVCIMDDKAFDLLASRRDLVSQI